MLQNWLFTVFLVLPLHAQLLNHTHGRRGGQGLCRQRQERVITSQFWQQPPGEAVRPLAGHDERGSMPHSLEGFRLVGWIGGV